MIFAFTGKMGSGKTTVCDYLVEKHGFVKVGFKDALVYELKEKFAPLLREFEMHYHIDSFNELFSVKPDMVRKLMQCYGTEVRRADDPDYWVKRWKETVAKHLSEGRHVVVDDTRFLNEAASVKEMGGTVVRIVRSDIIDTGTHQSEVEMDAIIPDLIIEVGKGQQQELYAFAETFISV